jgi:hypothetical protein
MEGVNLRYIVNTYVNITRYLPIQLLANKKEKNIVFIAFLRNMDSNWRIISAMYKRVQNPSKESTWIRVDNYKGAC